MAEATNMKWSVKEAKKLGLVAPNSHAWAKGRDWYFGDVEVIIDLVTGKIVPNWHAHKLPFEPPEFDTLEECLVYLRLRA
jgi:hypothetical protein